MNGEWSLAGSHGAFYTAPMRYDRPFKGAKVALFIGPHLLVIRRDAKASIPWPGFWDFPGGGREPGETPVACVLRETREEVGLVLAPADLIWKRGYRRPSPVWFFAARLSPARQAEVQLGSEGQEWKLMPPEDYLSHSLAIPHFADRLRQALAEGAGRA